MERGGKWRRWRGRKIKTDVKRIEIDNDIIKHVKIGEDLRSVMRTTKVVRMVSMLLDVERLQEYRKNQLVDIRS